MSRPSAVQAAPKSVPARLALANFYWALGRRDDAEGVLKQTVDLDPDNVAVESANASRGDRPWVPHPVSKRERERAANSK